MGEAMTNIFWYIKGILQHNTEDITSRKGIFANSSRESRTMLLQ